MPDDQKTIVSSVDPDKLMKRRAAEDRKRLRRYGCLTTIFFIFLAKAASLLLIEEVGTENIVRLMVAIVLVMILVTLVKKVRKKAIGGVNRSVQQFGPKGGRATQLLDNVRQMPPDVVNTGEIRRLATAYANPEAALSRADFMDKYNFTPAERQIVANIDQLFQKYKNEFGITSLEKIFHYTHRRDSTRPNRETLGQGHHYNHDGDSYSVAIGMMLAQFVSRTSVLEEEIDFLRNLVTEDRLKALRIEKMYLICFAAHCATYEAFWTQEDKMKLIVFASSGEVQRHLVAIDNHTSLQLLKVLSEYESEVQFSGLPFLQSVGKVFARHLAGFADPIVGVAAAIIFGNTLTACRKLLKDESVKYDS